MKDVHGLELNLLQCDCKWFQGAELFPMAQQPRVFKLVKKKKKKSPIGADVTEKNGTVRITCWNVSLFLYLK